MSDMQNPIRFGILGCANIARKVARAVDLAPSSVLYAIASRSIDKAKAFAAANGLGLPEEGVKVYGSYDQLLDDPCVDVVYMPLPTALHVRWAVLAANKKKHLLVEKPTALDVAELDCILGACESNGVQFMDGSMWLHHPRTMKMKELLSDPQVFGQLNYIHSTSTTGEGPEYFQDNIRVKPDLDALGDLGWYCIQAILWAKSYKLPESVTALPDVTKNSAGVIMSCTASMHWEDTTLASIHCSFLSHTSMDLALCGSNGSIHLYDYIIPQRESSASFDLTSGAKFAQLHIGWSREPEQVEVCNELPQEALMVQEMARLVGCVRGCGCKPDGKWPEISRKIQLVVDAVKRSIDLGCKTVYLD